MCLIWQSKGAKKNTSLNVYTVCPKKVKSISRKKSDINKQVLTSNPNLDLFVFEERVKRSFLVINR